MQLLSIMLICGALQSMRQVRLDYCRAIGVFVANPHVNYLEDAGRFRADNIQLRAKEKYDPHGLLNPGKMLSFRKQEVPQ